MKKTYAFKAINPKTGKIECYESKANDVDELQALLEFIETEAGYEIISVEELNPEPIEKKQ